MSTVINAELSCESLEALKKRLLEYRDRDLPQKIEKFVNGLLQEGLSVARTKVSESPLGKYITLTTDISPSAMGCNGILLAKGAVQEHEGYEPFSILLAVEFGAGVHYNPVPNPKAELLGYGVGTFPGQTHAFDDMWWFWDEKSQEWRATHGIKATMPMYNATEEMIAKIVQIARTAFV